MPGFPVKAARPSAPRVRKPCLPAGASCRKEKSSGEPGFVVRAKSTFTHSGPSRKTVFV